MVSSHAFVRQNAIFCSAFIIFTLLWTLSSLIDATFVAKTAMARRLLKVVYHVLKEKRPYIAAYNKISGCGAAFYFA